MPVNGRYEVSVYRPGELDDRTVLEVVNDLRRAFPAHEPEFWSLLIKTFQQARYSNERMRDAADHVIRTCEFPHPTIARFMNYDRVTKMYSYNEMAAICSSSGLTTNDFEMVKIGKERLWKMK